MRFSSETTSISEFSPCLMPIRELFHFTVRRFSGTGKTPFGGFTRADGRVRDRAKPGARAHPREGPRGRARVVFQLGRDRDPAERNVVSAVTGALFTH